MPDKKRVLILGGREHGGRQCNLRHRTRWLATIRSGPRPMSCRGDLL
jgi:hypothetical protein